MEIEPNNEINSLKNKKNEKLNMQQPNTLKVEEQECSRKGSNIENLEKRKYYEGDLVWVTSKKLVIEKRRACCS